MKHLHTVGFYAVLSTLTFCLQTCSAEVFSTNIVTSVFDSADYSGKGEAKCVVKIIGARNGAFSGLLVIANPAAVKGEKAEVSELKGPAGTISAKSVRVRYAVPDSSEDRKKDRFETLMDEPRAEGKVHVICITVSVPVDARPGAYEGTVKAGATAAAIQLKVNDWQLPNPHEFITHAGLIQSPESVALKYKDEIWSDKHFEHIGKSFDLLGQIGNKVLFVPILCRTHFGTSEGMVRWIRDSAAKAPASADSTNTPEFASWSIEEKFKHDFRPFDQYLDLYISKAGKPEFVCFYVWDYAFGGSYFNQNDKAPAQGVLVSLLSAQPGGKTEIMCGPPYGAEGSKEFWQPVMDGLHERMTKRGLPDDAFLVGIAGDSRPSKEVVNTLNAAAPYSRWLLHSHGGAGKLHNVPVGYLSHVWGCGKDPRKGGPHYGWSIKNVVTVFPRYGGGNFLTESLGSGRHYGVFRVLPETCNVHNLRGFGRIGADFWPVLDAGKGGLRPMLNRYPKAQWSQLSVNESNAAMLSPGPDGAVSNIRFENLREGIQENEARIFMEKALADKEKRGKLGEELAKKCETLLASRTDVILGTFKSGKENKGWPWFAEGWQERSDGLFALAAEVASALAK